MGTYGQVFKCESKYQKSCTAIKCVQFNEQTVQQLKNHIKQFFIYDIASSLEIGPKIIKCHGFDFIIFGNCLQFQMELCSEQNTKTIEEDLKNSLVSLHLLSIIHSDIKPMNVMFSNTFKKNILLDYGISEIIKQKIGEKTLTSFKGTYEYCGLDMKGIFGTKKKTLINLYSNDLSMLNNTFKQFKMMNFNTQVRLNQNQHKYNDNELSQIQQNENENKNKDQLLQMILYLKYKFYKISKTKELRQKILQEIFLIINDISTGEHQQIIIQQILNFSQCLRITFNSEFNKDLIQSLIDFQKAVIFKHRKTHIQSDTSFTLNQQKSNIYHNQNNQKSYHDQNSIEKILNPNYHSLRQKFKQIYQQLTKNEVSQTESQQNYIFQLQITDYLTLQNLQYILCNPSQLIKFQLQIILQMFLAYCSFWKSSFRTSIKDKQQISTFVKSFILTKIKDRQKLNQLQLKLEEIWPDQIFIKQECPNLIWMYGFLLFYTSQKSSTSNIIQFLIKNIPVILKDTVFLQFKYQIFLTDYLIKFITHLFQQNHPMLLNLIIIQCFQLVYLTESHFLIENRKQNNQIKQKNLRQNLYQMFCDFKKKLKDSQNIKTSILKKLQLSSNLQLLMHKNYITENSVQSKSFKQSHILKYLEDLVNQVQLEFVSSHSEKNMILHQKALFFIYLSQSSSENKNHDFLSHSKLKMSSVSDINKIFQKNKQKINILQFISLAKSLLQDLPQKDLHSFDSKINCEQISNYFFLKERYGSAYNRLDASMIERIINLMFSDINTIILNYNTWINVSYQEMQTMAIDSELKGQFWSGVRQKIIKSAIQVIRYANRILESMILLSEFHLGQYIRPKIFSQEVVEVLESMYIRGNNSQMNFTVSFNLLLNLPLYSLRYLKLRHYIYTDILKGLTNKQVSLNKQPKYQMRHNNQMRDTNQNTKSNILNQDKQYKKIIRKRIISLDRQQFQTLKYKKQYWKKIKLLHYMDRQNFFKGQFTNYFSYLISNYEWKQLANFIIQAARIIHDTQDAQLFILFNHCMKFLMDKQVLDKKMFYSLIIRQIKKYFQRTHNLNQVFLVPVYLHTLELSEVFVQNQKQWRTLLLKVCLIYTNYPNLSQNYVCDQNQISLNDQIYEKILFLSIKYIENIKNMAKKRKTITKLMRNLVFKSSFSRKNIYSYIKQYLFREIKINTTGKSNFSVLTFQKVRQLIGNNKKKIFLNSFYNVKFNQINECLQHKFMFYFDDFFTRDQQFDDQARLSEIKSNFCNKYGIFDLRLYFRFLQDQLETQLKQNFQTIYMPLTNNSLVDEYDKIFQQQEEQVIYRINKINKSPEFLLCQQTIQTIDQILKHQNKQLQKQLKQKYNKRYSQISWLP